jgi:hypothetical protein
MSILVSCLNGLIRLFILKLACIQGRKEREKRFKILFFFL